MYVYACLCACVSQNAACFSFETLHKSAKIPAVFVSDGTFAFLGVIINVTDDNIIKICPKHLSFF